MARYTGPSYKQARRVGFSISETGKELARRPYAPGQHGKNRRAKLSDYGTQLKEKQKVRFMYGLNERQFRIRQSKFYRFHRCVHLLCSFLFVDEYKYRKYYR